MEDQIAIIIPAYKAEYLEEALLSISNQTDKNFHLYIGDDAGDGRICTIVNSFKSVISLTYKRFDVNIGHYSLTGHWKRCFDMADNESWFWLFSDDDIMTPDCIKSFRQTLASYPSALLFKFDSIKFINDKQFLKENFFENNLNTVQFLRSKFTYDKETYVVEYIFHKSLLTLTGGFKNMPLGWCSDDLFWVESSRFSPIIKIEEAKVFWRSSDNNISGKRSTKISSKKKLKAGFLFLSELHKQGVFKLEGQLSFLALSWYFEQFQYLKENLSFFQRIKFLTSVIYLFSRVFFKVIPLKRVFLQVKQNISFRE